jgi:dolichol kinase
MSPYHVFIFRAVVALIAASVVIFIALFLLRSVFRGGRRVLGIIVRCAALLVCAWLASLAARGEIGEWGAWIGLGGATVLIGPVVLRLAITGRARSDDSRRSHSRI